MSSQPASTSPAPAAAPPARPGRRGFLLRLLGAVVLLAAIGWGVWYFVHGRWYEDTDDAYVAGNVVQITPQIPGTVVTIGVEDGDRVRAGQPLLQLDRSNAEVALDEAKAHLAGTVRKVRGLYSNVSGAQADVAARRTAVAKARADYDRRKALAQSGAISAEELAHARDELTAAQSALTAARQQFQTSKVLVDATEVASHPDVQAAAAKLRDAYLGYLRTSIVSPVDGYVAKRSVQLGQRVAPGTPLMAVVPLGQVWVDANFKETQLSDMRIGQPVEVTVDAYGGDVVYKARIESLGVGTGSAFSLLPAQNATGNWIKIVQRIPVRVQFTEPAQLQAHPLRIGLSSAVTVDVHDQKGAMLAQQPRSRPAFDTDVYQRELGRADALIKQIIAANMGGAGRAQANTAR